jgi:hypothetical protein
LSLALFGLFFTPWWLLAIAISTALGVAALREFGPQVIPLHWRG